MSDQRGLHDGNSHRGLMNSFTFHLQMKAARDAKQSDVKLQNLFEHIHYFKTTFRQ